MSRATGIGSFPGSEEGDYAEAVRVVLGELPDLPHVPEVPGRGVHAAMTGRGLAVMAGLAADLQPAGWRLTDASGADHRRARSLLAQDLDTVEELAQDIGGTFNWRVSAGTKRLSVHAFGAAVDINVGRSHYWRDLAKEETTPVAYKNMIPAKIVEVFEKHGFIWGGWWYHFDTMHFEYRPELITYMNLVEDEIAVLAKD